jgi:ABC-type multidrug transport system fused ATPase/permease subunit
MFSAAFGSILALLSDVEANNDVINTYCWYFLIIALIGSLTAFLYNFNFGVVGDRVVFDMRMSVLSKLLKLPISYYDKKENTPGSISTMLST